VANDAVENAYLEGLTSDRIWLGCNAMGENFMWTCPDGSGKTFNSNTKTANPARSFWSKFDVIDKLL
jgi:hypothetical protein